ncbi:MAG: 2,3,4,5-tetrahydropyridine-2,6-dicarboxylate N-succinyltransferase, partial [Henriciella sp.]
MHESLAAKIEQLWEQRDTLNVDAPDDTKAAVNAAIELLDSGQARVAQRADNGEWTVNQWLKKAVVMSFRLTPNQIISGGVNGGPWFDKVPSKFDGWSSEDFKAAGFRAVPPAAVRRGSFVAKDVVLMPSYVNIGANIGQGTMIDTWASIGSCAQIGAHCHISAGAGIGGVLEPLQANPTIIEDNCFIGARSEVVEGVIVGEGSVVAMGVFITQSTKIVDRETGEIIYGRIPPYSVVVPGSLP